MLKEEIIQRLSKLYSAVLCDSLDHLDLRHQAMVHTIRPLFPDAHIIGAARTLLSVPKPGLPTRPYQKELEALDTIQLHDVIVLRSSDDFESGVWGELLSSAARAKGAAGAIVDGLTRDAAAICRNRFSVFAQGTSLYDSYGRSEVMAYDVPVRCGKVHVNPGDIVFADFDGIIVIPLKVIEPVLEFAELKASREKVVDAEFRKGRKVVDVFVEHGIL